MMGFELYVTRGTAIAVKNGEGVLDFQSRELHVECLPGSIPDEFSRPLNADGIAHARAVADWIRDELEFPEMVLCSPSQRTRETLAPLIDNRGELETRTRFLPQIYGASVRTLINVLDHAFAAHLDRAREGALDDAGGQRRVTRRQMQHAG